MKKGKGMTICLILLFSMFVLFDFNSTSVKGETFDPFTETFTNTDDMDVSNTNVSGWGTGSIENSRKEPELIRNYDTLGNAIEIYVYGDIALVGTDTGLEIFNVSDPTNAVKLDSLTTSLVFDLYAEENLAYLAVGSQGLIIANISDPTKVNDIGSFDVGVSDARGVAVSNNYAYLTDLNDGIKILDVSDPTNPGAGTLYYYTDLDTAKTVRIKENFAYVANTTSLVVLNITDPTTPVFYSEFSGLEMINDIFIDGFNAYVADQSGLYILDITNPINPVLKASFESLQVNDVVVDGSFAYVASTTSLVVLDINDTLDISIIGNYDFSPGFVVKLFLDGTNLYTANYDAGFSILEVSNNIQPTRETHFSIDPQADRAINIQGDLAYVVGNYFGGVKFHGTMRIYNISDPTNADFLGGVDHTPGLLDFGHIFYDIEIYGQIAYVVGTYMENVLGTWLFKLAIYGFYIGDPTNPTFIGAQIIPLPGDVWYGWWEVAHFDLCIDGEYMYITCGSEGLAIYDFSEPWNPKNPVIFDVGDEFNHATDIYIEGDVAYVTDGTSGFKIFDISNPTVPVRIGWYDTSGFSYKVQIEGDTAYVADGAYGLQILDIEDLTNPALLGSYATTDTTNNVYVSGNTAFVSDANGGLVVLDVTNSTDPQLLYTYATPGNLQEIIVKGDHAFMVEFTGDFEILNVRRNKCYQFTDLNQAQSTTIFSGDSTSSLSHATLTSLSSVPSGTSISYFLSVDNGVNWEAVTPGVQHDFLNEGRNLKWRAILITDDFIVTPTISEITISYTTALASPELVSPSDGFITDDKTPKFTWSEVSGAHEYNFQLDVTPSFASPIINTTQASSLTSYTVEFQLPENTYYWRVAAVEIGSEVGYYSQPRSIIIEQDISPPDINHPNDFSYLQGTIGHNITWLASDSSKASYNITRDGALQVDDVWTEEEIIISVDGLSSGIYVYVCNVYDQFDQFSSDTVLVTVSTTQPPTIDDIDDFSYEEGTTGYNITWHPSDNNPEWYNVTRNGVIIIGEDGAWDGSSITIFVDGLEIGTYTYICTVYDAHGNSVYDSVIIDVIAPIIPTINHPLDFEFESGDTGNTITWVPYDNNPDRYIIESDGEAYDEGIWTGDEITVNVDNLDVGTHTIVCTVFDIHDNTAEDTVIVTVVDTTDPTIDHPSDISYTFGDTGYSITWHPNEINPQNYIITLDGEVIDNVFWEGESITVEVDGSDIGVYTYRITVTDTSGNSVSDSVTVTVTEQATTPTTPTPTDEGPLSMFVVVLSFVIVSSLFYYRKRK